MKNIKNTKKLYPLAIVIALAAIGAYSLMPLEDKSTENPVLQANNASAATAVESALIEEKLSVIELPVFAQVFSDEASSIISLQAGFIKDILVSPGAQVKKGQILVRLDDYYQTKAVGQASLAFNETKTLYEVQKIKHDRFLKLAQEKHISEFDFELIKAELVQASLALERAKLSLAQATEDLRRTEIKADRDGVVFVSASKGQSVAAGQKLGSLDSADSDEILISVPEKSLGLADSFESLVFSANGIQEFAVITSIKKSIDPISKNFQVFAKSPTKLVTGTTLDKASLITKELTSKIVPSSSILFDNDRAYVYSITDEQKLESVDVKVLGQSEGGLTRIEIDPRHTKVVKNGSSFLKPGQQVVEVNGIRKGN